MCRTMVPRTIIPRPSNTGGPVWETISAMAEAAAGK